MVRPRLSRPQPDKFEPDGSWRAAYYNSETPGGYETRGNDEDDSEDDYKWTRPGIQVPRRASLSFPHSPPRSSRGPTPRPSNYSSYHSHNASPAHRHGRTLIYIPAFLDIALVFWPIFLAPKQHFVIKNSTSLERLPGTTERNFGERGALGFDRGGEQPGSYIPRSGSLIERPGLFTERLELSELPASTSSSFGALQTPRASKSHNSIGEARGRMPTRPPFELRMSSGDTILSPSPGVTPSSTTPISEPSSESSTIAHMTSSTRILPHMASNSTSASDADSAPQLTSFHLVLVIDKLDPQSVFPRDLHRYMDVFYQQIAFKMTAMSHFNNIVNVHSTLASCRGYQNGVRIRHQRRGCAHSNQRRTTGHSITSTARRHARRVASTGIPEDGVDPHADFDQGPASTGAEDEFEDEVGRAEDARRFGWWLPRLLPWKGLLLLEDAGPGTGAEMITFIDDTPLTLQSQGTDRGRYPAGMKVIYTAAPAFKRPLPELSASGFSATVSSKNSTSGSGSSQQPKSGRHASALSRERENARLGKEVAQVVGKREIKRRRRKRSKASDEVEVYFGTASGDMFDPSSPELMRRHGSHSYRRRREPFGIDARGCARRGRRDWIDDEDVEEEGIHGDGVGMIDALLEEDSNLASAGGVIIAEPAEATQLEMRWMEAMVEGRTRDISKVPSYSEIL
ncbi:hypothetical protein RHS01_09797 [Rhizoctonia solani]|uniref:Uncharacterized protein n=1 Tax=Rhizoctonia solani TaxID=456999 RepID=A0A8H7M318_9AGAM|nr:hypothetical protein RHS01_09797 [Rhizoctonia solani]